MVLVPRRREASSKGAVEVGRQRMPLARAVVVVTGAAVVVVGGLIVFGLWWFGIGMRVGQSSDTVVSIVQLAFAFVAGVGGSVGLTVAYRKHLLEERAESREDSAHFNERYGAALDQLASDRYAVRLGGVYAMASLADDWGFGRQRCIDVLCASLRRGYRHQPWTADFDSPETAGDFAKHLEWKDDQEFRHTIIRVIAEHLRIPPGLPRTWCGLDFDFTGVAFDGGDFSDARFTGGSVKFTRARFTSGTVDFGRTTFSGGRVDFHEAEFDGATVDFTNARFSGATVDLRQSEISGGRVVFMAAKFEGGLVDFRDAQMRGGMMNFSSARFDGGDLTFATAAFTGGEILFVRATFADGSDIYLTNMKIANTVDFSYAEFFGGALHFEGATLKPTHGEAPVRFACAKFEAGSVIFAGSEWGPAATGNLPVFSDAQLVSGVLTLPPSGQP